ncbi:xanthine dehydrogenase family protein molybdopterin-binding subunit [Amorphus orientalis]|uniref:CO/xanthine dehydrogenase Mo-binding subunit n=1 Tax=Amorphus orientalis TaxID=649198 RepID=A0AAE3VPP7_9HYPH|nr:xanthine dehydrogenase family protein molybdopterin-binding subunit [Amorphus orientalis]MDQ0316007.1 CO/xanthine dehydrogenase Mo-binding subunit [Amorphus orientalis]
MRHLGRPLTRLESGPLVAGRGWFVSGIALPDQLALRVIRSPYPHARITDLQLDAARAVPGVVAVWTSDDLGDVGPIGYRVDTGDDLAAFRQPILARDVARYVGEPVAVVIADTPAIAEDAAERVEIGADLLDVAVDSSVPHGPDTVPGSLAAVVDKGYGDVDAAFSRADVIVELDLAIARQAAMPLETRGLVAKWDGARDVLEVYGAAKLPHIDRDLLAGLVGRPASRIFLYEGHVGGSFGVRGEIGPEDVLVCLAALRLGRPVGWVEDRREHILAASPGRAQRHLARVAAGDDGRLLAIDVNFQLDQGAYLRPDALTAADLTAAMLPGPYELPAYRVRGEVLLTNKTPLGPCRGGGVAEAAFVRERLMDAVADRLGIDPTELRARNLIPRDAMPFKRPMTVLDWPVVYDSGDYAGLLERAAETLGIDALHRRLAARRAKGELVGLGLSIVVEPSAGGGGDGVRITIDDTGTVEVVTGAADIGQGVETVIAQIVADILAVPYTDVRVVHGRTDWIGFGQGARGNRTTVMTGTAAQQAAEKVREKALAAAAALIGVSAERLMLEAGEVRAIDHSDAPGLPIGAVARALRPERVAALGPDLAPDDGAGLSGEAWVTLDGPTYPYAVHAAVVAVDEDTGAATVERYLVAADVGNAINPRLIEGQLSGGAAHGIGGALSEELAYSPGGEPLAMTLSDYVLPTADQIPDIECLIADDAPSPLTPLGMKGCGGLGTSGAGAAIAAAIDAAIGQPGAITELPVTPARLRAILRGVG